MLATLDLLTDAFVRAELRRAFETLSRLPERSRPAGYRLMHRPNRARPTDCPSAADIDAMDRGLGWLELLRDENRDVRLSVALRAQGLTLRQAAAVIGSISAPTVSVREARGIAVIIAALRGFRVLPGFDTVAVRAA